MNKMIICRALAILMLATVGQVVGCGDGEVQIDRGDPNSPDYVVKPDPEAFGNRYAGSPLDPNPPKKEKQ